MKRIINSRQMEEFYASSVRFSKWLADLQHEHRVWPRLQLIFWGCLTWRASEWFFMRDDISMAQGTALAAIWAAAAAYGKFYGETDPRWIQAQKTPVIVNGNNNPSGG